MRVWGCRGIFLPKKSPIVDDTASETRLKLPYQVHGTIFSLCLSAALLRCKAPRATRFSPRRSPGRSSIASPAQLRASRLPLCDVIGLRCVVHLYVHAGQPTHNCCPGSPGLVFRPVQDPSRGCWRRLPSFHVLVTYLSHERRTLSHAALHSILTSRTC